MEKTIRINITVAGAVLCLILSLAAFAAIPYCIPMGIASSDIGPRRFPQMICLLGAVLCVIQLVRVALHKMPCKYSEYSLGSHGRVLLAMVIALAAAFISEYVNIILVAAASGILYLVILKAKDWRYYATIVLTAGLLFLLTHYGMHLRF